MLIYIKINIIKSIYTAHLGLRVVPHLKIESESCNEETEINLQWKMNKQSRGMYCFFIGHVIILVAVAGLQIAEKPWYSDVAFYPDECRFLPKGVSTYS